MLSEKEKEEAIADAEELCRWAESAAGRAALDQLIVVIDEAVEAEKKCDLLMRDH